MTEADLFILLDPVLPDKVFPSVVPQDMPAISPPWIIFSFYEIDEDVLSGQAETMTNIQIDVYAKSPDEATEIRNKAFMAIKILLPTNVSRKPDYEPDTALHRRTLEFQVWN
ncbi:hypothetical protein [Providencia heimbachae]|uniref:Phage protein n=1 Tax=Providencia heimbachae ATCC 35613 TaxID=1354272 RepID=A0A1B7K1W2_9GAMM|nr:hypothetical protein [Providencia heimbachae]OAT53984.1 phage protein [Providencia heimbachae ATCC 35613]SQH13722.1 Protein of uncharacterised function (DUF3168) [Providencia heimbachae]